MSIRPSVGLTNFNNFFRLIFRFYSNHRFAHQRNFMQLVGSNVKMHLLNMHFCSSAILCQRSLPKGKHPHFHRRLELNVDVPCFPKGKSIALLHNHCAKTIETQTHHAAAGKNCGGSGFCKIIDLE